MKKRMFMLCLVQMHALVVMLMGAVCFIGRITKLDSLTTWHLDQVGMAGSTGLAFIVLGLAVFLLAGKLQKQRHG